MKIRNLSIVCAAALLAFGSMSHADEALIRKNLSDRIPQISKVNEVAKSHIPGLFEIRVNDSEIIYTDATGDTLIQGAMIDTKSKSNLTQERVNKMLKINFDDLPIKDALTIVKGNGKRVMAIFEDPNCGYCKKIEKDLEKIENVTIHIFLYPVLGADSMEKSKNIWCAKNKEETWDNWMIKNQTPAVLTCDTSAITRNIEFGKKHKVSGTPTIFFKDGSRVPGAIDLAKIESFLNK